MSSLWCFSCGQRMLSKAKQGRRAPAPFRTLARCWPGLNSRSSLLERHVSRFTTLSIKLESVWFVVNHFSSGSSCGIMSFFCLAEFRYQIKGTRKIHFRRFTAVIHNFLPTLLSQLSEVSFQSTQKITLEEDLSLKDLLENIHSSSNLMLVVTSHQDFPTGSKGVLLAPQLLCSSAHTPAPAPW